MSDLLINGFGDDLSVNGVRIGDLTPLEHEKIEKEKGGQNYAPLENVVISKVKDSSTLIARKPDPHDINKYIESEILDGLCCYSAVNQGQLNQTIVDAVIRHLDEEKLPKGVKKVIYNFDQGAARWRLNTVHTDEKKFFNSENGWKIVS